MRASGYYVVAGLLVLATVPMYRYIFARARALDRQQPAAAIASRPVVSSLPPMAYGSLEAETSARVPLLPDELCEGGVVILVTGSTYTQMADGQGRPSRCEGRELIRSQ